MVPSSFLQNSCRRNKTPSYFLCMYTVYHKAHCGPFTNSLLTLCQLFVDRQSPREVLLSISCHECHEFSRIRAKNWCQFVKFVADFTTTDCQHSRRAIP